MYVQYTSCVYGGSCVETLDIMDYETQNEHVKHFVLIELAGTVSVADVKCRIDKRYLVGDGLVHL